MMNRFQFLALTSFAVVTGLSVASAADEPDVVRPGCYELRIYDAAEGKLEALKKRFRDHTLRLFTRHGMTHVAYWMPVENPKRQLVYLLSYPDAPSRDASWNAFAADPDWVAAKTASEVDGPLVDKVESRLIRLTDFSPPMAGSAGGAPHCFEMRTYHATPGNLPRLLARFRDHTVGLFSKHGMRHFGYFTPFPGQPGADDTLVYFLEHDSAEARDKSFTAFSADPDWQQVKVESEKAAGGPLTVKDGVKSQVLRATDFSPVK
jgi:hypothetical protein